MNKSKDLIVYKESFIAKIRKFFRNLFGRQEKTDNTVQETTITNEKTNLQEQFLSGIKIDSTEIDYFNKKQNFLKQLEGNVKVLNRLSIDRLKKLEEYYDGIIEQNEQKIKKMNAKKATP